MSFDIYDIMGMLTLGIWTKDKSAEKQAQYHSAQIIPVKYSFRPKTLEEYIGQQNAKERILLNIEKIKTMKPIHFILSGTRGHGKTTLAYIIANILNLEIDTYVGGSFTIDNLTDFVNKNNKSLNPRILFVDEVHGINREVAEFMYPLLEDFIWASGGQKVRPFIFIGATTDKNILSTNYAPLVDRCASGDVVLEHYVAEDIKTILKQYNDKIYQKNITENIYDILSNNTRFNPRTSIAMFEDFIVCKDINKVLNAHKIVKDGLTIDDIIVLKHLAEINKPVGVEVLAIVTQQTRQDYITLLEPFLIQQGYISRTARGRVITEKGKELLATV
jgi:Holliday junction DNA helicase RuvB